MLFRSLVARGTIKQNDRVVVISTAHGLKFTDFKVNYHERALSGIRSRHANPPIYLKADSDAVLKCINSELARRKESRR